MLKRLGSHFRGNVVAYVALFFALGGTAVAAKPLITGADVQDGSLTGADISDASTLKGADIDESDLGKVGDADTLDTKDSTDFLGATATAADSDLLDGMNSTAFLGVGAKAADSDLLDGMNSTAFLGATAKAADSDLLDGMNSTAFLGATAKAADSDLLDGLNSSAFLQGKGNIYFDRAEVAATPPASTPAVTLLSVPGFGDLLIQCRTTGLLTFWNTNNAPAGQVVTLWTDNGGADPTVETVGQPANSSLVVTTGAEFITYQLGSGTGTSRRVATVVAAYHTNGSTCNANAQGVAQIA